MPFTERFNKDTYLVSPQYPIRWSAIFGGWVVATAAALLLYAIGAALGIGVIRVTDIELVSKKTVVLTGIWLLITWVVALYLGGLYASRGIKNGDSRTSSFHAVGVWALSTVLTIIVGASGVGATGLAGIMAAGKAGEAAGATLIASAPFAAASMDKDGGNVPADFQAQLKYGIREILSKRGNKIENETAAAANSRTSAKNVNQAVEEVDMKTLMAVGVDFLRGDKEAAKNSLAINTSLTKEESDQLVESLSAKTEEVKAKLKEAADKAAVYTSMALWVSILINLFSLQAAVMGGRAGAYKVFEEEEEVEVVERKQKVSTL